jgi:predicted extracellular nuclease
VGDAAYSYQFAGESGYLDHAFASPSLSPLIKGFAEWHANADEPISLDYNTEFKVDDPFNIADPYRASDHDPLVIGLDLTPPQGIPVLCGTQPLWAAGWLGALGLMVMRRRKPRR